MLGILRYNLASNLQECGNKVITLKVDCHITVICNINLSVCDSTECSACLSRCVYSDFYRHRSVHTVLRHDTARPVPNGENLLQQWVGKRCNDKLVLKQVLENCSSVSDIQFEFLTLGQLRTPCSGGQLK